MAAVTSQSWSVVGKSTKKPAKQVPRTLSKDQRKSFIDKMPRIESQAPVKESSTIYDAFLGKSSSEKSVSSSTKAAPSPRDTGSHKGATNRKKKTETASDKKKEKLMTFDEAINKLDSKDLSSILTRSQTSFPDNEDVWLKDLASYLNVRLETDPDTDPVFKNKPKDFPMSKLNSGCRELLKSTLKGCNSGTVEHLFYHCVQAMLTEMGKGTSTYGYRIFLQSLASQQPNVASNKNSQYLELLKANQNRPAMCLSILWALGLGGTRDLRAGLRVWLDLMVPMMTVRTLASYPVDYLDSLLQYHKDHKSAYGVMTIRDFFPLLDLIFSNTLSLPTDLKKKLIELYPKIKTIAFGADPKTTLRLFFPSFLSRATPESKPLLRNEVLPCLITCLMTDRMCFSVWRQMYIKHLSQSSVLLEHLSENWPQVSRKLEKKLLHETLQTFSVTNDELTGQGRQGPETTGCSRLCRELLLRMSQTAVFSWFWLLFLIVSLVAAIIAYDVYTASNYRMSRSWRFLEEYGILSVLQQGWSHVNSLYNQVFTWMKINVPFYYARTCDTAGPYIRDARIKLVEWYTIVYEATTVQRHWVATKSVEFISWMYNLSPDFWEQVRSGALTAWAVFKDFVFTLARLGVQYAQIAYVWIIDNIINDFSVEKISRLMTTLLLHVQKLGASFVHWCGTVLGTTTK